MSVGDNVRCFIFTVIRFFSDAGAVAAVAILLSAACLNKFIEVRVIKLLLHLIYQIIRIIKCIHENEKSASSL